MASSVSNGDCMGSNRVVLSVETEF